METTMTLSHLADLIIVISFFSICGAGFGYIIAELISLVADGIKKALVKRKDRKAKVQEETTTDEIE